MINGTNIGNRCYVGSFIVLPEFGSRKRMADTLGNLPEQLDASFDGSLAILHFDQ
ncbi:MAG TPA: hypothetical protein VFD54_05675 [Anaerolineales bacterium]|nr:hypothetical protein [Anaerolineales bacterium]